MYTELLLGIASGVLTLLFGGWAILTDLRKKEDEVIEQDGKRRLSIKGYGVLLGLLAAFGLSLIGTVRSFNKDQESKKENADLARRNDSISDALRMTVQGGFDKNIERLEGVSDRLESVLDQVASQTMPINKCTMRLALIGVLDKGGADYNAFRSLCGYSDDYPAYGMLHTAEHQFDSVTVKYWRFPGVMQLVDHGKDLQVWDVFFRDSITFQLYRDTVLMDCWYDVMAFTGLPSKPPSLKMFEGKVLRLNLSDFADTKRTYVDWKNSTMQFGEYYMNFGVPREKAGVLEWHINKPISSYIVGYQPPR